MNHEALEALRLALAPHTGVRFALVFGSVARGTAGSDSDLDIAVDADPATDLAQLSADLSHAVFREAEVVNLRDAGIPLLEELLRDGIVVFERQPHAAATWRARVLSDMEIDRAWYARMRDAWLKKVAERGLGDGQS